MVAESCYLYPRPCIMRLRCALPLQWHRSAAPPSSWGFDASDSCRLIERYNATHLQAVPTMFVRLLKLPDEVRLRYDVSSLKAAIHAPHLVRSRSKNR